MTAGLSARVGELSIVSPESGADEGTDRKGEKFSQVLVFERQ
jgi:hypothetical protein